MSEENTTQNPGLTLPDDAAPVSSVSATDRLLAFNEGGDPVTATPPQIGDYLQGHIPYVGKNLCAVHNFTLTTNAGNNQLPPEGFARQSPLLKSGQTYILSGKRNGERGGQCMVSDGGVFKLVNFYTPFTPENDVETIYFRSTLPSSTVVYSDVKIEVGSKATPFIPGVIPSVLPFSLTEQLVPGEFWDGNQVYQRTFKLTTSAGEYTHIFTLPDGGKVISGYGSSDINPITIASVSRYVSDSNSFALFHKYNFRDSILTAGTTVTITLKYTKA